MFLYTIHIIMLSNCMKDKAVRVLISCKQQQNNWLGLVAQRRKKRQTRKEGVVRLGEEG